nr:hypothetical protein [Tanacetum cinerariifolium]
MTVGTEEFTSYRFKINEFILTPPLPPPAYRTIAWMFILAHAPVSFSFEAEVDRLLAIPTPPPSPLTLLSSPLPHIPSPSLPVPSPLTTSPTYTEALLGFRAAEKRLRIASPLPSPTSPPTHHPLPSPLLPPPVGCREDIPKADIPPRKRLCLTAPTSRRHVPREVGYGITDTWDELVDAIQEGAPTTLERVNARVTELAETHKRDTQDLYAHLENAQDSQARLSGKVDILIEDRQFHQQVSSLQSQLIAALDLIQALQLKAWLMLWLGNQSKETLTSMTMGVKVLEVELAWMCGRMFLEESDVVEKYVGRLPDMIQGNVMSTKCKTMEEAVEMTNNLMDQKLHTWDER